MISRFLRECQTVKGRSQNPYIKFLVFKFLGYSAYIVFEILNCYGVIVETYLSKRKIF